MECDKPRLNEMAEFFQQPLLDHQEFRPKCRELIRAFSFPALDLPSVAEATIAGAERSRFRTHPSDLRAKARCFHRRSSENSESVRSSNARIHKAQMVRKQ
ncbi:hypothetical protein [Mesorhizobium sp. M1A.T.Ca.IN.004.03.1.1]|uniref:hypothetical protein n=1 Tax=Mesorhizobium sp. M1A.T.Ca.IN.004.03.1.1 TaxID=2496795 RepID=UPI0013E2F53A|nr:hypothetical protein [Mesorhizobium sp. M1A.T.Ca.IN.004.03.1.1]